MLQYSRDFLLSRQRAARAVSPCQLGLFRAVWRDLRPRKRGRRGGVRQRARRRMHRLPLPSVVFGNVRSIRNKTDELAACVKYLHEYREANLICFSESWLHENEPDPEIPDFTFHRLDRSREETDKERGGGVCVCVNSRWCTNVTVKESFCCVDIELISVALRPFYLPREFNQIFVTAVYIHPEANVKIASLKISDVIHRLSSSSPDSPSFVMGDFNKCRLNRALPHFRQYVTCLTYKNSTIDLCYGNISAAYRSRQLPKLGKSDHYMVQLVPLYRQQLKRVKPVIRTVKKWTSDAIETLNGCFESTDWDVLMAHSTLDEATDVVSSYINFCVDNVIEDRQVKSYGNNKPWVTPQLRALLVKKRTAFKEKDEEKVKAVQREIDRQIRADKRRFKTKLENNLTDNNPRLLWKGIETITGYKPKKTPLQTTDEAKLADELNTFYTRFDKRDFTEEQKRAMEEALSRPSQPVNVSVQEVRTRFRKVKSHSAAGPDNISGRTLKECSDALAPVFTHLFQRTLDEGKIPDIWKTSIIVPVAKKRSPKELNDYRPIALTSIAFKCAEKIVLQRLRAETAEKQDPLQFAYSKNKSTEDAILTLLHNIYYHLERPKAFVRVLFIDFSSAFNTIQPHLMVEKLLDMSVNPVLIRWIYNFLTGRPQQVRVGQHLSSALTTNTGAPQGCVLSPVLFTLYTADCRSKEDCNLLVKFADDTSLSGLIQQDEASYMRAVQELVQWCDDNFLELNVTKTKELIIDFRKVKPDMEPIIIKDQPVEVVQTYKYLGTIIDDKLSWSANIDACCRKASQRMYFLRKLRSFHVNEQILSRFYQAVIQSVMLYNQVCYYSSAKRADTDRLERITRTAARIVKEDLSTPSAVFEQTARKKLTKILTDPLHPLHGAVSSCTSNRANSRRLRSFKARTTRMRDSFLPAAVRLYNASL